MDEASRIMAVFVAGQKHGHRERMDRAPDVLNVVGADGAQDFYEKRNTLSTGASDAASVYVFYAPYGLAQRDYDQLLKDVGSRRTKPGWWQKGQSRPGDRNT